jgi:cytochrome c-type biogenesis protein CcmH/NrfG
VLEAGEASQRLVPPDPAIAQAHACFRLGQHLLRGGQADQARVHFDEAIRLHPDSWNIWRQAAEKDARGLAAGPDFWARVDALGEKAYYAPIEMKGVGPAG